MADDFEGGEVEELGVQGGIITGEYIDRRVQAIKDELATMADQGQALINAINHLETTSVRKAGTEPTTDDTDSEDLPITFLARIYVADCLPDGTLLTRDVSEAIRDTLLGFLEEFKPVKN